MVRWKIIFDSPNYEVSNDGRVRSRLTGREIKPRLSDRGFLMVTLYLKNEPSTFYIHSLVGEHFLDDWRPKIRVGHKNLNRLDNRESNLYCKAGVFDPFAYYPPASYRGRPVRLIESGEEFASVYTLAKYIGGDPHTIYKVLRGERSHHLGYTFEYVEE